MEIIKNIINSEKFILINYTTKIKNKFDFLNLQIGKINNNKYNKIVFLFNVYYLPNDVKIILYRFNFIPLKINESYILLLNKDNYLFLDLFNIHNVHKNTITNFLNDDDGKNTICNICCNSCENLTLCCRCAYNMCLSCHSKLNSDLCPVCKYKIGTCIKIK